MTDIVSRIVAGVVVLLMIYAMTNHAERLWLTRVWCHVWARWTIAILGAVSFAALWLYACLYLPGLGG